MNYFEFYELPVGFNPDQNLVKQRFYALSKKYHPDFFINESAEKQEEVLELSTLNNKAFQVLKNPKQIVHYVLSLKGFLPEGENYQLPQDFLMDMMEVNEALMDLAFDDDKVKRDGINAQISEIEKSLSDRLLELTALYDGTNPSAQETILKEIKDIYYRSRYIDRIKEKM